MRQSCADALATEEPDALIAHVRVCGGAGRVTVGSPRKRVIGNIGGITRPPHDQPPLIQQETQFPTHNPAMIREAFAANLLGATAFAYRMDQLDPIGIDDAEHGRSG